MNERAGAGRSKPPGERRFPPAWSPFAWVAITLNVLLLIPNTWAWVALAGAGDCVSTEGGAKFDCAFEGLGETIAALFFGLAWVAVNVALTVFVLIRRRTARPCLACRAWTSKRKAACRNCGRALAG